MEQKALDTGALTAVQAEHLEGLLDAADRARKLRQPEPYKRAMEEVYVYYFRHHPDYNLGETEARARAEDLVKRLPRVRTRGPARLTPWKLAILLVVGIGAAYAFIYLFFNHKKLNLSPGLLLAGLFAFSLFMIILPMLFSRK